MIHVRVLAVRFYKHTSSKYKCYTETKAFMLEVGQMNGEGSFWVAGESKGLGFYE